MNRVGIVRDAVYLSHRTGSFHPECPERLEVLYSMLDGAGMGKIHVPLETRKAERDEITLVHSDRHFGHVAATAGVPQSYLDADTQTSEQSFDAALCAAGAVLRGVDLLMAGECSPIFALVRPPGHHAEHDRAMGFCLFNNIAIGARYAIEKHDLKRIVVVDWDLHHGNGTQHAFYDDNRVLYFSTHQYPYYPGTGDLSETGQGSGTGYTVNVPLPVGMGDRDFYRVFREVLEPIVNAYRPELVLVSAGFDTYFNDPLGGMAVTPEGFASLAGAVQAMAQRHADGRLLLALEGGYHLEGLRQSVKAVIEQLAGAAHIDMKRFEPNGEVHLIDRIIEEVKKEQREFWPL